MKRSCKSIFHLKNVDINECLNKEYRQYFIGKLGLPQLSDYIEQEDLEIGMSLYKEAKADVPHKHGKTSEILYILDGIYRILVIDSKDEYMLEKGDFFVLPPKTAYASKAQSGTQVLFIKTGGNDKEAISVDAEVQRWLNDLNS